MLKVCPPCVRGIIPALVLALFAVVGSGCVGFPNHGKARVPVVALAETPAAVQATVLAAAHGRRVEKVTCIKQLEGPLFRAYITEKPGPQLLTVDGQGGIVDNAVVIPFADMPEAVRNATTTAVAGRLCLCRKSIHRPETTYVVDYLISEKEPVYALIDARGTVLTVIGYAQDDGDDDEEPRKENPARAKRLF
jgi:hypothetical protein